jgi:pyrimidine operon attenuation protein / uracil phosphoribosyltransferase
MQLEVKSKILEKDEMNRIMSRMAHEILEKNHDFENLVIIGIKTRGAFLAERLAKIMQEIEGKEVSVGALDITFYRDDLTKTADYPLMKSTEIPCNINDKKIILVDDVLYTGRTVRAGLEALMALGRPQKIQLAVLIDRGHKELPISADFIGKSIPTSKKEIIKVQLQECDGAEDVLICVN